MNHYFKNKLIGSLSFQGPTGKRFSGQMIWKLGGANDNAFLLSWRFLARSIVRWLVSTAGGSLNSALEVLWETLFSKDGYNNLSHPT